MRLSKEQKSALVAAVQRVAKEVRGGTDLQAPWHSVATIFHNNTGIRLSPRSANAMWRTIAKSQNLSVAPFGKGCHGKSGTPAKTVHPIDKLAGAMRELVMHEVRQVKLDIAFNELKPFIEKTVKEVLRKVFGDASIE